MDWNVLHLNNGYFRAFKIVNVPETLKTEIMKVKIKTKDGIVDATAEVIDGDMIVSPKVEKFEPKDGDVVFVKGAHEHILIYKEENLEHIVAYFDLIDNNYINGVFNAVHKSNITDLRPANEKEMQKLFDKLKEKGLAWDAEKKEVVTIKWKPEEGSSFWLPFHYGISIEFRPFNSLFNKGRDEVLLDKGWCFKTEDECKKFCNRLNDAINSVKP